jgi:hypothetical protein
MARKLQNRLALAQYKTNRGWEDLSLDTIEPKVDEELRRRRPLSSGDILSDSSSSSNASEFHYPSSRTLMSSPLKSSLFFSDQLNSGGSTGHRKRSYHNSFDLPNSGSGGSHKRFRSSPTAGRKNNRQFTQSSPIKPRKQPHFTTSAGPDLSFYRGSSHLQANHTPNFAAISDDEDDTLPVHSFNMRSSPPRTPPRNRGSLGRRNKDTRNGKSGEEGADLLLYLATSPSPAHPPRSRMAPPSTPPPKNMALPSSVMTPSAYGGLPQTPGQNFEFSDFINVTPSPGQRAWRTPGRTPLVTRTPQTAARRGLTYESLGERRPSKGPMQIGGELLP